MLKEDPRQRPNIYQLMKMTSALRRLPCPIHNIYPEVTESFAPTEPLASATANIFSSAVMTRPMDILPSIEPMRRGRPTRSPANSTPGAGSTTTPTVDATQSAFSSAFPPLSDINSGFDDSFGQFTELADPAAKFTQVSSAGDAFDFGSPSSSNHGGIKDSTSKQRSEKRFTLDFETGRPNNEFGFNFATGSSSPADSKDSAAAKPRPPSFDLLRPETQLRPGSSNSVPKQPSGASGGLNSFMSKPTANDLFFGTSSELKPDQSSVTNNHARSITPQQVAASQSSGAPKPLLGSRQPSQQSANSESSGTMPSSTLQGYHPSTSVLNRNMYSNGTGNSRAGSSAASSVASPNPGHRPTGSIGSANSHFNSGSDSSPSTKMENLALLQRQQIEQLGRFSSESTTGSPLNQQTPQGSTRPLDSSKTLDSKTLDGLKAQDLSSRVESFVAGQSAVYSGVNSGTNGDAKGRDRKSMGYKEAIQQDMEAELKLIQAQQKEFERQQQELFRQQRQELEEQQRQHRVQQEQLQKQQQQQIQIQHEKWQERKRLLKDQEREQLMQNQDQQRKELEQRHLNQQQQLQQNGQLPEVSDLAASIASVSLNSQPAQGSVAAMSALYSGNSGGIKSPTYPPSSTPLAGFSMPTGGSTSSARASLDDPGLRSQTNLTGLSVDSHSSASAPFVPVKSARRTGAGIGASGATPVPGAASSTINATAANVYKARRASVNNLPPGQKPELMPKPTRFRMKDGTGLLHSGEEEAFRRKFPSSADFEADLIQFGASSESSSQQHTSSVPSTRGKEPGTGESGQWKEQPAATTANTTNLAYHDGERLSRSSAARREYGWQDVGGEYSHGNEHEEEEEEETLVRSRPANRHRHQDSNVSITGLGPQQTGEEPVLIDASDAATPLESVRERVLRMNRVGRIA
ncbi:hypothetical protein BGW38_001766 [Lunasporangiospora selenospora]|uniref:Uncharacterized protein n=1 Tax=Lunasporangiospora selenospora TaxID=979761 RepID=A0A9P6KDB4_9FUNG|nr:hypothetical protein BGW38_001766 [Lunasporangiospora selenospora]